MLFEITVIKIGHPLYERVHLLQKIFNLALATPFLSLSSLRFSFLNNGKTFLVSQFPVAKTVPFAKIDEIRREINFRLAKKKRRKFMLQIRLLKQ